MSGTARYAASRVALAVPTLFGLSFLSFVLGSASGDPSSKLASAGLPPEILPTAEQIDAVRHRLGFDKPLIRHPHQQRVKCARLKAGFFHQVVAMAPLAPSHRQCFQELEHLLRWSSIARHVPTQRM